MKAYTPRHRRRIQSFLSNPLAWPLLAGVAVILVAIVLMIVQGVAVTP